ncbi:uncharacterized protein EV154DRAFT_570751 [Mucor mucedo]|uniref:uncharacterized protein n=1 Tax=Mucor mucedo TaxID=29922 RepID=UPI00221E53D7|nr:uncharacterized protein EV154DRAFT_570751 [Mucor mucedo]KAI7870902.1 hypothetical protein EV154DRAFT_570751 [Mucor mucedo]
MIENVVNDELMCDITHRGYLFFFFAWFHASFAFLFLWEKFASFFGSVCASASSGRRPLSKTQSEVIGELFVLCDGKITPIALANKNSLVSSSSSVSSFAAVGPSPSDAPSSSGVLSSSVVPSPSVLARSAAAPSSTAAEPSPAAVAFSSVFLSPFDVPSVESETSKQSFVLRSAPVSSQNMDRQFSSLDFARVAGLPCPSDGNMPTIGQPIQNVSSGVSFGVGCEAITQALLAAGVVPAPAFGGDCGPSVSCPLAVGEVFSPLLVSGDMSDTSVNDVSDMDVDDVVAPASGDSGVLGESVASPLFPSGPSVALAPATETFSGTCLPPCGLDLLSATVSAVAVEDGLVGDVSSPSCGLDLLSAATSAVVAEDGLVGGGCSAENDSGVAVASVVSVPRPVATPRRLRSGGRAEVSSAVCAVPVAATVVDAPLCSPAFSSSLSENQQSRGKRRNDAPPPPSTVRACFVRPLGDRKLSLSGSSDVSSLSVAPVASVGSVSSFPVVASVPSFDSFGSVAAVSSAVPVSAVSSVSSVPVVEGPFITVSPVRPMAKPRVAHYEKARERLVLKALFDRAEKEEEDEEKKEKEKEEKRSSLFRRK